MAAGTGFDSTCGGSENAAAVEVIIVNQQQVGELLPMQECMEVMDHVLRSLARGECVLPLRQIMWLPDNTCALGLMPCAWSSAGVIGLKAISYFPGNEGTEYDSHQGAVMLFECERGRLLALIDATSITAIRTAAVSGVATRKLARPEAATLAILGSGVQARTHLEAMLLSRRIRHVRVCSKTLQHAASFAAAESARHGVTIEAMRSARDTVTDADIICTTTSAREPVLKGEWIRPGTHINAVGSSVATVRELDSVAVQRSRLIVDRLESAVNEAGDFILAREEGVIGDEHIIGEIGEVLLGRKQGCRAPDDITLFKSVGMAVEDLASAQHIYDKAHKTGAGMRVEFGGSRIASH